jgi:hypothetical protein
LQNDEAWGPVFFRQLGVNCYPEFLAPDGTNELKREDYVTFSVKLAAGWNVSEIIGSAGSRLIVAGELGHAFDRPSKQTMRIGSADEAGGWAWQVGADLRDFVPRHSFGVLYGHAQAGWLITSSFRENEDYFEVRYIIDITDGLAWEFRGRRREEIDRRIGQLQKREDLDLRTRITYRF